MSQDSDFPSKLQKVLQDIAAFAVENGLELATVREDIGGRPIKDWPAGELQKYPRIGLNINLEFNNPSFVSADAHKSNPTLVSSSLFAPENDTYYNNVVASVIKDITHEQDFYQVLTYFLENNLNKALKEAMGKNSIQNDKAPSIVVDTVEGLKKDVEASKTFNKNISQALENAFAQQVSQPNIKLALSKHFQNVASSQTLFTNDEFLNAANRYLASHLEDFLKNIQNDLGKSATKEERLALSKVVEHFDQLKSKIQITGGPGNQGSSLEKDLKKSIAQSLNSDERFQQLINGFLQSKINFIIKEEKEHGKIDASTLIKNDPNASQLLTKELNDYISGLIAQNMQASQFGAKSTL